MARGDRVCVEVPRRGPRETEFGLGHHARGLSRMTAFAGVVEECGNAVGQPIGISDWSDAPTVGRQLRQDADVGAGNRYATRCGFQCHHSLRFMP
jgi:hypothetical protein